jgi:hypothetical protein
VSLLTSFWHEAIEAANVGVTAPASPKASTPAAARRENLTMTTLLSVSKHPTGSTNRLHLLR